MTTKTQAKNGSGASFQARQFEPTQWSTAGDKAKFANDLWRFCTTGFPRARFTKQLYRRLCQCFQHIAHYDQGGFWQEWFEDRNDRLRWIAHILRCPCYGDPAWTYSDVERAFQQRLRERVATWERGEIPDSEFVGVADERV